MKDCLLRWDRTSQLAPITAPDLVSRAVRLRAQPV